MGRGPRGWEVSPWTRRQAEGRKGGDGAAETRPSYVVASCCFRKDSGGAINKKLYPFLKSQVIPSFTRKRPGSKNGCRRKPTTSSTPIRSDNRVPPFFSSQDELEPDDRRITAGGTQDVMSLAVISSEIDEGPFGP